LRDVELAHGRGHQARQAARETRVTQALGRDQQHAEAVTGDVVEDRARFSTSAATAALWPSRCCAVGPAMAARTWRRWVSARPIVEKDGIGD
jgi:hypothetical protein